LDGTGLDIGFTVVEATFWDLLRQTRITHACGRTTAEMQQRDQRSDCWKQHTFWTKYSHRLSLDI
jgi:hypothetical protein